MTPVTSQTTSSQPEEPTVRAMSALTMKMPDPIMDPMTIIVESRSPSSRLNSRPAGESLITDGGILIQREKSGHECTNKNAEGGGVVGGVEFFPGGAQKTRGGPTPPRNRQKNTRRGENIKKNNRRDIPASPQGDIKKRPHKTPPRKRTP